MLLEGAGAGCGVAVQGAGRDVELVSWPHMSAAAMHREGERAPDNASVNVKVIVQDLNPSATATGVLGGSSCIKEGSLSMNFSAVTYVCSALLPQVGEKKGLTDVFLNRESASFLQII